jgi:Flp pilus assembly pilin Flp
MKPKTLQRGVTSIEYGLLAALIALAVLVVLSSVGTENSGIWERWTSRVIAAIQAAVP